MWLYPIPALIAIVGFIFVLTQRPNAAREIRYGIVIIVLGVAVYFLRAWRKRAWPFGVSATSEALAE